MRTIRPVDEYQIAGRGGVTFTPSEPVSVGEVVILRLSDCYSRRTKIVEVDSDGTTTGVMTCRKRDDKRSVFGVNCTKSETRSESFVAGDSWLRRVP